MSEHPLNTPQVTVLLVSTSCGIGFLMERVSLPLAKEWLAASTLSRPR